MSFCQKTLVFLLLSLTISSLFTHGASNFPPQPPQTSPKPSSVWGATRESVVVGEGPSVEPVEYYYPYRVLAAQRTQRKDPLNGFKKYNGGWDLNQRHYWSSVGFTAVPLFAVAVIWFLVFGLFLLLFCLCHFCCKRRNYGYHKTAYTLSLVFLVLFSIAAICGCVVLYTGQEKFHRSATSTLDFVSNQADSTVARLKNVSDYLAEAKQLGVDQEFLPSNVQTDIDQIGGKINASASNLADTTAKNSEDIKDLLDSMRLALIILAAIMLILIFLGLLFSLFGMQILVYILVIAGWLLVTGTFILGGTFLLLHNVAADTCVAMNEWAMNPTAHTALDEIMPCVDKTTGQETLMRSKEVTSELVDLINMVITNVSNINFAPNFVPMYFNQSGPLVPLLCNPYFHDLSDRACDSGEVDLYNATQVWASYVCQASANGICTTVGRLSPALYGQMNNGVGISVALNEHSPFLVELQDCSFAKDTFTQIYTNHCPSLRQYSKWVYIGLAMVATAVMLSLVFWVVYSRERRRRRDDANHPRAGEVEPNKDS